jgi:hypothetical protein
MDAHDNARRVATRVRAASTTTHKSRIDEHLHAESAGGVNGIALACYRVMRRKVVAVSTEAQRVRMLDGLLDDPGKYEVVILESIEHAYARVRHERPDLVIVYLAIDDDAVCLLLSMLAIDPETLAIPVQTWAERFDGRGLDALMTDAIPKFASDPVALSMN